MAPWKIVFLILSFIPLNVKNSLRYLRNICAAYMESRNIEHFLWSKGSEIGLSGVCALPLGVRRQHVMAIVLGVISLSFLFLLSLLLFYRNGSS